MQQRVVITGMGVMCPLGLQIESFWKACLAAPDIVSPIPQHWHNYTTFNSQIWTALPSIDFDAYGITRVEKMQQPLVSLLGLITAQQALDHAGFTYTLKNERKNTYTINNIEPHRMSVFVGTGVGGLHSFIDAQANHTFSPVQRNLKKLQSLPDHDEFPTNHQTVITDLERIINFPPRFNPFIVSMIMPNACAANIAIRYSLQGPNHTNCTACSSGTIAIGQGFRAIRNGETDVAITGGVEYLNDRFGGIFRGFDVAKTLVHGYQDPQRANRPFDKQRTGFLFSEGGCAFLVLESLTHAQQRGAAIIAEIVGYAESFDAHNIMIMEPCGTSLIAMIKNALNQAGIDPVAIDYINAHGTGTQLNDEIESQIIQTIFGSKPLINSTKSLIGHTIGAAGAIEALVTALSLTYGTTHINKNLDTPLADLNFVTRSDTYSLSYALTQSFAFGGHNAALILKKYTEN